MYMTLSSNTGDFTTNETSHFRVQLPKSFSLKGNWEVALVDIQYPLSWNTKENLKGKVTLNCYYRDNILIPLNIRIPSGSYGNVQELVDAFQHAIEKKGKQLSVMQYKLDLSLYKLQKLYVFDRILYSNFDPELKFDFKWKMLRYPKYIPEPRALEKRNKINGPSGGPVRTDSAYKNSLRRVRKAALSSTTETESNNEDLIETDLSEKEQPIEDLIETDLSEKEILPSATPLLRKWQLEAKQKLKVLKANLAHSRKIKNSVKQQKLSHLLSEIIKVSYSEEKQRVLLDWQPTKSIKRLIFDQSLRFIFGFESQRTIKKGVNIGNYNVNINNGESESEFFVNCNLLELQTVGNSLQQLLRTVPVTSTIALGNTVHKEFASPHYISLLSGYFDTIEIWLTSENGKLIDFQFGKVILKLHF